MEVFVNIPIQHSYRTVAHITKIIKLPVASISGVDLEFKLNESLTVKHAMSIDYVNADTGVVTLKSYGVVELDSVAITALIAYITSMKDCGWGVELEQTAINALLDVNAKKEKALEKKNDPIFAAAAIKKKVCIDYFYMVLGLLLINFVYQFYSHDWTLSFEYMADIFTSTFGGSVVYALFSFVVYKFKLKRLNKQLDEVVKL